MDIFYILIVLIFLLNFDLFIQRKLNDRQFKTAFQGRDRWWILFLCMAIFLVFLQEVLNTASPAVDYPKLFFICVMAGYLYKRNIFKKLNAQFPETVTEEHDNDRFNIIFPAVALIFYWVLIILLFTLVLPFLLKFYPPLDSELGEVILTAGFSSLLMVALIVRACGGRKAFLDRTALRIRGRSVLRIFFIPVLIGIAMAIFSSVVILSRADQPSTPLSRILKESDSPSLIGIFIALAVMLAPLCEEIVFRGYIFDVTRRFKGQTFAFYFVALTFAILHIGQYWKDWTTIAVVTILAFVLSFLRIWSGSTVSSVITHYVYNGLVTLIPILMLIYSNPAYFKFQTMYNDLDTQTKEELLKKSIETKPEFIEAYNDLAWLYAQEEEHLDEALTLVEKALKVSPTRIAYLDTKAEILYKMGRVEEAIALEEDLVHQHPEDRQLNGQLKKFRNFMEKFQTPEVAPAPHRSLR